MNWQDTPVYITNFNNLERGFARLIEWLLDAGLLNITIIDNASTWEPLLEYYSWLPDFVEDIRIIRNDVNRGPYALWEMGLVPADSRFILTDPDVVPDASCPSDIVRIMHEAMDSLPASPCKVGPSLRIDDLPSQHQHIWDWEIQFWKKPIVAGMYAAYEALIDTTFALYQPGSQAWPAEGTHYRLAPPYVFRHLPWYETSTSEERDYYIRTSDPKWTHWAREGEVWRGF
jgi:hypothetical protein